MVWMRIRQDIELSQLLILLVNGMQQRMFGRSIVKLKSYLFFIVVGVLFTILLMQLKNESNEKTI